MGDHHRSATHRRSSCSGVFLNTLINFVFVAIAIFFFVVKPMQVIAARNKKEEAAAGPTEVELLTQIRDELAKRPRRTPESR